MFTRSVYHHEGRNSRLCQSLAKMLFKDDVALTPSKAGGRRWLCQCFLMALRGPDMENAFLFLRLLTPARLMGLGCPAEARIWQVKC